VLVSEQLHDELPLLQQAAPHARLINIAAATPREIAAADVTFGVCSAEVLAQAKQLAVDPMAGRRRRALRAATPDARAHLLLTNLQRTMGPPAWPSMCWG